MNILFYLFQNINESSGTIGGVERHTLTIKKGLELLGYSFFFSYAHFDDVGKHDDDGRHLLVTSRTPVSEVRDFIVRNKIDVIHIQQNDGSELKIFKQATEGLDHVRIVTTYHFCPGYELGDLTVHNCWVRFLQSEKFSKKIKWLRRLVFLPLYIRKKKRDMIEKFRLLYSVSNPLVVLCNDYVERFSDILGVDCSSKIKVINNCTTFEDYFDEKKIKDKQKEIVIVSRLEETYKRLSIAINIWKRIQKEGKFPDWHMTIVGEGYSRSFYDGMIRGVANISLVGRQDSKPYFERGSIYLNTSKTEGWCLCCGEAMQMGVVPIAFSSWGAVFDIIDNDSSGFIIPDDNTDEFYYKLVLLMENDELRRTMSEAAIRKSQEFSREKFLKNYMDLYNGR
jgi:glycosyltransferase involved in cell wall biosynthesis